MKREKERMAVNILPHRQAESQAEYAYRVLHLNIMECNLLPGSPINEGEVAGLLGISRTPVHEAVNRLKEEGLVDIVPRKESRVSRIKVSYIHEGVVLRCATEPQIAKQAAGRLTTEHAKRMEENLEQLRSVIEPEWQWRHFFAIDGEFHRLIYEAVGMMRIFKAVSRVANHLDRLRYLSGNLWGKDTALTVYEEHRALYHMLLSRGSADLEPLLRKHMTRSREKMDEVIARFPGYFE